MNAFASGIRMLGYCDDWHASPGSTIAFKVSCDGIDSYKARIGRVICADLDPLGPGFRIDPVARIRPDPIKGRFQPAFPGSFCQVSMIRTACPPKDDSRLPHLSGRHVPDGESRRS